MTQFEQAELEDACINIFNIPSIPMGFDTIL
jgi:hypothetical protein